jgi:hypothetical protein
MTANKTARPPAKPKKRLTAAEKAKRRVAIAKDVLAQLTARRFKAQSGMYIVATGKKTCKVCALGALFVAGVEPDVKKAEQVAEESVYLIRKSLRSLFTTPVLEDVEAWFEGSDPMDWEERYGMWLPRDTRRSDFYRKHPNDTKRMRLIMQNIVDNKGTFKPELLV